MSDLHNMSQPASAIGPTARAASGPTLVERAYEHLLSMLMTVKIAPGERIPIDTVARQLGISQTPIREALSQLEAEKLVYKTTNVGYRSEEHTSELQSLMRISYAVFCFKKKT